MSIWSRLLGRKRLERTDPMPSARPGGDTVVGGAGRGGLVRLQTVSFQSWRRWASVLQATQTAMIRSRIAGSR